jgi:chemotaxis protein MotB
MRLHQHLRREQGRHTDDWLITYADTITLLLCLFVVILSMRTGGRTIARDAAAPVARPAASEDIFGGHPPFPPPRVTVASDAAPFVSIVGDFGQASAPPERLQPAFAPIADVPWHPEEGHPEGGHPEGGHQEGGHQEVAATLPSAAVRTEDPAAAIPSVVDRLRSVSSAVVEQRGDRITTVQIDSGAFFASGYAVLSGAGKVLLRDLADRLKSDAFAAYHITIEGHTDDMPINTPLFQSNWELSTARAAAVVRFFLEQGISARKLSAAGYADTFPVAPNRTEDGTVIPENQARNRRVVIRLEKIDKAP